ncbi:MAG TPA: nicotinamide riboside transporter PnuC [Steroidobacteraceae bacterium]
MAATEIAAVAFGIAYILLAIREHRGCWIAGGVSSALYAVVFFGVGLPMQSLLQLVYVALSVYGWVVWGPYASDSQRADSLQPSAHLLAVAGIALATAFSAPLAARYALATEPLADSLGTWASLFATWLLARRYIDTWTWWVVIDTGLAALFASQGLWPTAGLYLAYAVLAIAGWRSWRHRRLQAS